MAKAKRKARTKTNGAPRPEASGWVGAPDLAPLCVPVESLTPDPRNARLHDDRNRAAIASSLRKFGQQKPIVVDASGVVIAGNGTLAEAIALGWTTVAVVRTQLNTPEARAAFAIADNRTAELAAWDADVLDDTLTRLGDIDVARDLHFERAELDDLLAAAGVFRPAAGSMPDLASEPKARTMTFTLTAAQVDVVTEAVRAARSAEDASETGNANGNGNALAAIAQAYLDAR